MNLCFLRLASLLLLLCAASVRAQSDQIVYDNALENGWLSYGWATLNYSNSSPVHGTGGNSISVSAGGYEALYLHHAAIDTSSFVSLTFWINGGASGGQTLQLQATVNGSGQTAVPLTAPAANTWTQVTVTLSNLGVAGRSGFDGFWIQNTTNNTLPTFYVDDITLNANPPPTTVQLTADAGSVVRTVDARIFGLNTAIWDGQLGTTATRTLLSQAGIRSLRYPGGSSADDYDWYLNRSVTNNSFQWASPFPTFAAHMGLLDGPPYIIVNYGSGTPEEAAAWVAYANGDPANSAVIGTDSKGRNWQTVGYWASLRAASPLATDDGYNFLRIGRASAYAFKYWEIGNECYGDWEHDEHGTTFPGTPHDPYTYAQNFAVFRQKMLSVDPTLRIGAVVTGTQDNYGNGQHGVTNPRDGTTHTGWTPVVLTNLKILNALPAFLTFHDYPQEPGNESDAGLLAVGATLAATDAASLRQMLTDYIGGTAASNVELALTELNNVTFNPGKQSTSLVDGLFLAEAVSSLAATEFNACTWWDLRNGAAAGNNNNASLYGWRPFGDYGIVAAGDRSDTPVNTPYPTFYAWKLLTHWAVAGDKVVTATSNYPLLTAHAALRAGGDLCLLVVNKSPSSTLTAQIAVSRFVPGASTATVYQYGMANDTNSADLTTTTLSGVGTGFSATFPPYSMTVIDLKKPVVTAYSTWQGSYFSSSELGNPGISGDGADPDGDGIPNLMEYALGLNPRMAGRAGLPTMSQTNVGGSSYLTLTYTKVKADTDLTYVVEVSSDLLNWYSGSAYTTDVSTVDGAGTQQVTTRDQTPMTGAARRFIRLRVTR